MSWISGTYWTQASWLTAVNIISYIDKIVFGGGLILQWRCCTIYSIIQNAIQSRLHQGKCKYAKRYVHKRTKYPNKVQHMTHCYSTHAQCTPLIITHLVPCTAMSSINRDDKHDQSKWQKDQSGEMIHLWVSCVCWSSHAMM